jgi:HlyB family type I secretion system ABC transporter
VLRGVSTREGDVTLGGPRDIVDALPLLSFLSPEVKRLVVASFEPQSFAFAETIIREGDPADAFYVLVEGRARVVKEGQDGREVALNVLKPGDTFGEMALIAQTRRTATVRASGDVRILRLDRVVFQALLAEWPEVRAGLELRLRHRTLHNFFRVYSAFAHLPLPALELLLSDLETADVAPGTVVIRQGDPPGPMYVVEEGRLRVYREQEGATVSVGYLRKGDFFGEISLFRNAPRLASVEAVSACRLVRLGEATFRRLIAEHPEFRARLEERMAQYDYKHVARVPLDFADELLPAEASAHDRVGPAQADAIAEDAPEDEAGPFASGEGLFVKRRRRIRRMPFVRQIDEMDCGAACLAMVCRFFGRAVSLTRIRQLVHTSMDGTSLAALCSAGEGLGLAARAVKASRRHLDQMPLPAIAHWEGNHWIVLYDVRPGYVRVADPGLGVRRLTRHDFEERWSGYASLFDYTDAFAQAPEGRPGLAWLWPLLRPYGGLIARAILLALLVTGLQLILPVMTQVVVDRVLVEQDVGLLRIVILAMAVVSGVMVLAILLQRYLFAFIAVRMDARSLDFVSRRLLSLPMSYFSARRTGDIQRRLAGMRQVRSFLVENGVTGLTAAIQLFGVLALMVLYSPLLAGVFLITAPVYVLLMHFSARMLRPILTDLEEAFGRYQSHQLDAIKGVETVKAMGAEGALRQLMLRQFHDLARRQFKADFTILSYQGTVQAVTFFSVVLFLWIGAHQVMSGSLTIGGLVAFNTLVAMANAPLIALMGLWDDLQYCAVLMARLDDVFGQEPEQGVDHSRLLPVRTLEGHVRFQNVGFHYGGPESPRILEGLSFEILPGRTLAIVGRSGSGKTTLAKCMAGLLEPTEGTILYDGIELKSLRYRDLRRHIGFVLQETYLFDETIARNIACGEEEPDVDRVMWAARIANAHAFIERLPLGYDTRVGESGLAVSAGQRQRIAIARALYPRPAVLVFDEATSALDSESERAVQENLQQLLSGQTSVIIAHRLSTIRNADLILVLEQGRVVEQGSHDELMKREGLYFYLCSQQLEL